MTAAAWAWIGWALLGMVSFVSIAEWLYDEHIDPPEDDQ